MKTKVYKYIISIIIGLLLIFSCNSDTTVEFDNLYIEPQQYFGYLGTAMPDLGTGNYIAELSRSSNIATISSEDPEDTDYISGLVTEARDNGMKSIIWVDHLFFCIKNWGTPEQELYLYPDYQERWDRFAPGLAPCIDSIFMFYVLDEAYWNGSRVGISQIEMKEKLEIVASTIRTTFPNVEVGSCFGYPSLVGDIEIPENYTLVGFNNYYSPEQSIELYFENYSNHLNIFKEKMYLHQKLFLVPGGFQHAHNPASQDDLILVADFFYDLFLDESVEMMVVFLYPSVPPGLIGLEELPELMIYYEDIGNLIINPDRVTESEKPTNYIIKKSKTISLIDEEEFDKLYDETINIILEYNIEINEEIDLYEQARELVEKAQIIADGFYDEKAIKHIQHLIIELTKEYGELYINMKKNEEQDK